MFFESTTQSLVAPIDREGPWMLLDPHKSMEPTIPCMACHQSHKPGLVSTPPDYSQPQSIFYARSDSLSKLDFYDRIEKNHIPAEFLPELKLVKDNVPILVANDIRTRNCVQCHAPNGFHEAGTSDDRTPRGVHLGIGCTGCHATHSNDARQSCQNCHPAISNCNQDVLTMNTTFSNPQSSNNIHWVDCKDCHDEMEGTSLK